MQYKKLVFTGHAVRQMFKRQIHHQDVVEVLKKGETVKTYPDDRPYPSQLLLGKAGKQNLHVVVAWDAEAETVYVITAYKPDPILWLEDFKTRRD